MLSTHQALARLKPLQSLLRHRRFQTSRIHSEKQKFDASEVERVSDECDVCIVGAGPAGLSAAIRLKQLASEKGEDIRVVVLEKGAEVGKHLLIPPYLQFP